MSLEDQALIAVLKTGLIFVAKKFNPPRGRRNVFSFIFSSAVCSTNPESQLHSKEVKASAKQTKNNCSNIQIFIIIRASAKS